MTSFQLICVNREGAHVELVIPTVSGTPDSTTFGEFMISFHHSLYMHVYTLHNLSVV